MGVAVFHSCYRGTWADERKSSTESQHVDERSSGGGKYTKQPGISTEGAIATPADLFLQFAP